MFCFFLVPISKVCGQIPKQDSLRCKALFDSLYQYQGSEPDKALYYAETLKQYTKKHQLWSKHIETYVAEAQVYAIKANWDKAQKILDDVEQTLRVYSEFLSHNAIDSLKADIYSPKLLIASMTNDQFKLQKLIQEGLMRKKHTVYTRNDSSMIYFAFYYQYLT